MMFVRITKNPRNILTFKFSRREFFFIWNHDPLSLLSIFEFHQALFVPAMAGKRYLSSISNGGLNDV